MYKTWTEKQKKIYEGLKSCGDEMAGFFEGAMIFYYDNNFPNRVYYLAHSAREIDGGLRDFLCSKEEQDGYKKEVKKIWGDSINGEKTVDYNGHIGSIMAALDLEQKSEFSKKWFEVAKNFNKYAHRYQKNKYPRESVKFEYVWKAYEDILEKLIGSFYSMVDRLERKMNLEIVDESSVSDLSNLFSKSYFEDYFFRNLDNLKWFFPLNKNEYFSPQNINTKIPQDSLLYWNVLDYLECVSEQAEDNKEYSIELLEIIKNLIDFIEDEKLHDKSFFLLQSAVKIICNISMSILIENKAKYDFEKWMKIFVNAKSSGVGITEVNEKLLPKFLKDESTKEYGKIIIEEFIKIKPSEQPDLLGKREVVMVSKPFELFNLFDKNKEVRELINTKFIDEIIILIADRLEEALKYNYQKSKRNFSIGNACYQIQISRTEEDNLSEEEIGFIEDEYECNVMQFADKQIKGIDVDNDFWTMDKLVPEKIIEKFGATQDAFVDEIKKNLPTNIDWLCDKDFVGKLGHLFTGLYHDYLYIWFKTLEDTEDAYTREADRILTVILRNLLLDKCRSNIYDAQNILKKIIDKYHFPIFKKLSLFCINKYYDNFSNLFEDFFKTSLNVLEEPSYEVEIYSILSNRDGKFSPELLDEIEKKINAIPEYYTKEGYVDFWKWKWLSALREQDKFKDAYDEIKKKIKPEGDRPYNPIQERFSSWVGDKSPLLKDRILSMEVLDIVSYLNSFKSDEDYSDKPNKLGLAEQLRQAVKENPKKFIDEINLFTECDYQYIASLISGLDDAWNMDTFEYFDWKKVFDFLQKLIKTDKFKENVSNAQKDENKKRFNYELWIVENIARLIEDGSKRDARAFDREYFDQVDKIFDELFSLINGNSNSNIEHDAIGYALNTVFGRLVSAFIIFSLRKARVGKKDDNWGDTKYKKLFKGIEAYIYFGWYLPQMSYLDKHFVEAEIKELQEKQSSDKAWQNFMEGYIIGSPIYKDLYELMRDNYTKTIESKIFKARVEQRLVQHICVGYFEGQESFDDATSLFYKILNSGQADRWIYVVEFFDSISNREDNDDKKDVDFEKKKNKILEFREWTYGNVDFVKQQLDGKYGVFIADRLNLIFLLDKIDEKEKNRILEDIPSINENNRNMFFVKQLKKFEDKESVKNVNYIFLEILKNSTPTYPIEDITSLVENMYKMSKDDTELKENTNEICNTYGRRGIHFLREVFDKNN